MAASGFTSIGNFRKMMSDRAIKSKYEPVIKTAEDLEHDRIEAELKKVEELKAIDTAANGADDDEVDISEVRKAYTVDDLTSGMDS